MKTLDDFKDDFKMMTQILGKGAFAEVQKCQSKINGEMLAAKIVEKEGLSDKDLDNFRTEVAVLEQLDHPMISKYYQVYENESKAYLVTELCPGTDLFTDLEENEFLYDETKASIIIRQILEAVAYCHDKGIVHRDIKPDNIMIDVDSEEAIKLIDFGLSHEVAI